MEKKNGAYLVAIIALAIAVVGMSIGFAFADINLNINGDVTTKAQAWDIHFDSASIQVTPGSVVATVTVYLGEFVSDVLAGIVTVIVPLPVPLTELRVAPPV